MAIVVCWSRSSLTAAEVLTSVGAQCVKRTVPYGQYTEVPFVLQSGHKSSHSIFDAKYIMAHLEYDNYQIFYGRKKRTNLYLQQIEDLFCFAFDLKATVST